MKKLITGALLLCSFAVSAVAHAGIVAWSTRAYGSGDNQIYIMNDDGSRKRPLVTSTVTTSPGFNTNTSPTISSDGTKVAFISWVDEYFSYEIFVINVDGSGLKRLTYNPGIDGSPTWSPDGSKIVFSSEATGSGTDIFSINQDGTNQTILYESDSAECENPSWSPDGSKIVFSASGGNAEDGFLNALYTINPDGTDLTVLRNDGFYYGQAEWSRDGKSLVCVSSRDTEPYESPFKFDIYSMNADGSHLQRLTTSGDNLAPTYDEGGNIFFSSSRDGNWEIYSINLTNRAVTRLTNTFGDMNGNGGDYEPSWGVGYIPNHSPVTTNQEVEGDEDTPIDITLSATDEDNDELTYSIESLPQHGTLSLEGSQATYLPNPNFNGSDSFTFLANDGAESSQLTTVQITFNSVNDLPVVNDNYLTFTEDEPIELYISGSDADNDVLSYRIVSGPFHGSLSPLTPHPNDPNGLTATYTPDKDFFGYDSVSIVANDGKADSEVATVILQVVPANDTPVAGNDRYALNTRGKNGQKILQVSAPGVLANDADVDADSLHAVLVQAPSDVRVQLQPNGSFTFDPKRSNRATYTFTYKAVDGSGEASLATVTVDVNP